MSGRRVALTFLAFASTVALVAVGLEYVAHHAAATAPVPVADSSGELVVLPPPTSAKHPGPAVRAEGERVDLASAGERGVDIATGARSTPARPCEATPMTADRLDEFFRAGPDLLLGADYQRAIELEDGRVLWTFQDGYLDDGDGEPTFVHNVGLLQDGRCSEALHLGDSTAPRSWIGSEDTIAYRHWFWPLDGYQLDDDTVVLFVAEMVERGDRYLANPEPIATWITEVDLATMTTGELRPAPDPGAALHGFDIVDDGHHRYLYAQCHRQFGFGILGHDECAGEVLVARQPIDDPSADLRYWDGVGWSDQPETARDIAPQPLPDDRGTVATPMQVAPHGDEWIAVTKLDDWWSTSIRLDRAPQPHGPWTTTAIVPVEGPGDPDEVATYFATFVPSVDRDRAIAVSANRWDGRPSPWYRPHVTALPIGAWDHNGAESRASDVVLTLAPG